MPYTLPIRSRITDIDLVIADAQIMLDNLQPKSFVCPASFTALIERLGQSKSKLTIEDLFELSIELTSPENEVIDSISQARIELRENFGKHAIHTISTIRKLEREYNKSKDTKEEEKSTPYQYKYHIDLFRTLYINYLCKSDGEDNLFYLNAIHDRWRLAHAGKTTLPEKSALLSIYKGWSSSETLKSIYELINRVPLTQLRLIKSNEIETVFQFHWLAAELNIKLNDDLSAIKQCAVGFSQISAHLAAHKIASFLPNDRIIDINYILRSKSKTAFAALRSKLELFNYKNINLIDQCEFFSSIIISLDKMGELNNFAIETVKKIRMYGYFEFIAQFLDALINPDVNTDDIKKLADLIKSDPTYLTVIKNISHAMNLLNQDLIDIFLKTNCCTPKAQATEEKATNTTIVIIIPLSNSSVMWQPKPTADAMTTASTDNLTKQNIKP